MAIYYYVIWQNNRNRFNPVASESLSQPWVRGQNYSMYPLWSVPEIQLQGSGSPLYYLSLFQQWTNLAIVVIIAVH